MKITIKEKPIVLFKPITLEINIDTLAEFNSILAGLSNSSEGSREKYINDNFKGEPLDKDASYRLFTTLYNIKINTK